MISKLLILGWIFISLLLANLYKGIVVENMVAPKVLEYPETFQDLRTHKLTLYATESLGRYSKQRKSILIEHLEQCLYQFVHANRCIAPENLTGLYEMRDKLQAIVESLDLNTENRGRKDLVSTFELRIIYTYGEKIQNDYEKFLEDKITFEENKISGEKLVEDYLHSKTISTSINNLTSMFENLMLCNGTIFVEQKAQLMKIRHRLPIRSIKTGNEFFTSNTNGYEEKVLYGLTNTGSSPSDEKVPRNFRAVFESGIFNAWQVFTFRMKYMELRIPVIRKFEPMKMEKGIISFFIGFCIFLGISIFIFILEQLKLVMIGLNCNVCIKQDYAPQIYYDELMRLEIFEQSH